MKTQTTSIHRQLLDAGVKVKHWQTDIHVPVNDVTRKIVDGYEFKNNVTRFICSASGAPFFDIPFQFESKLEGGDA